MTPQLTVNLLRVLFLTFCGAVGSLVFAEAQDNAVTGLLIGLVFGLILVLVDRLLKGLSLRAFSSAIRFSSANLRACSVSTADITGAARTGAGLAVALPHLMVFKNGTTDSRAVPWRFRINICTWSEVSIAGTPGSSLK